MTATSKEQERIVRKVVLLLCVGLAGAGTAILPSLGSAQGTTASFVAVDSAAFFGQHFFYLAGTTNSTATIAPGGTVTFSYPTGTSSHNVVFTGPQPTSCTQTAAAPGYAIGAVPPLPATAEPPGWSGSCVFNTVGTYPFDSAADGPAMSGTVVVTTQTTTTTATTTTTTTTTGHTTQTFGYPTEPPAASGLAAAAAQRGSSVRGKVHVTVPGSQITADLLYAGLRIGRTVYKHVGDGTRRFAIGLNLRGRRALASHHSLRLTLRVDVYSSSLGSTVLSRHVTLTA